MTKKNKWRNIASESDEKKDKKENFYTDNIEFYLSKICLNDIN